MRRNIRAEVTKGANENPLSVIKRFTKKVSGSGVLRRVRALRYRERPMSELKKKNQAIRRITKRAERERLYKLGKLESMAPTRSSRH